MENYLHFMKNCIRPHYEKLKPLKSGFMENSNFENNRDPCRAATGRFKFAPFRKYKGFVRKTGCHIVDLMVVCDIRPYKPSLSNQTNQPYKVGVQSLWHYRALKGT